MDQNKFSSLRNVDQNEFSSPRTGLKINSLAQGLVQNKLGEDQNYGSSPRS